MAVEELQSIINRCQILEEEDFKEEDFGLFQLAGQKCLEEGYIAQVLDILENEKNKVIIRSMGWNLVGPVVRCFLCHKEEVDKREKCLKMLGLLVKLCHPKELLLGLLELIEEASGNQISEILLLLLDPLQTVIQKLHSKKAYSVGLTLSTLWSQLSVLPVPYTKEQIQKDEHGLGQCCKALVTFTRPFVEEVVKNKGHSLENSQEELKAELLKFCFKSLKYPLLTAQFIEVLEENEEDPLKSFASEVVGFILAIGDSLPKVIFQHGRKEKYWDNPDLEEEEASQLAESMASLAYLVFVQRISIDQFPLVLRIPWLISFTPSLKIFSLVVRCSQLTPTLHHPIALCAILILNSLESVVFYILLPYINIGRTLVLKGWTFMGSLGPLYLLQYNMEHIKVLLKRAEESVSSKGLDLLESSLLRMEDGSLLHHYLEIRSFLTVPQKLVKVMTFCPIETLRKKGLKVLQLYIDKLDSQGKNILFRCLLKTSNHAGVEGYVIQNIKNQVDASLKRTEDRKWFTGPQLISLLDLVLTLPEGAETDLLQNSDRIMASLNLLRYLVIKDNESDNHTGLWTERKNIETNFLKPLHTGLNMSKAHYEAEIKSKKESRQESHNPKNPCPVTVGGEKIPDVPNMTPEMQLQVLHSALFTFDLIESVLARVEELFELKTKPTSEETARLK
ncbi:glomulin isoform X1 [Vombatus ursinus]|uniref:glomulin isoform X1 n=1 Tax=Vombatus ursinus TaxID=29139 RepID=UPI000FFD2867|nr:glomulin isoform X1 [Vombatus ursinus]XP_027694037.1 glomulin isoform X1 [Vombatus ursinus]